VRTLQSTALRTVLAAAVPVGLVVSAAVVWQSTSAAFSATTENPDNNWRAGSVVLSDSDSGAALFNSTNDSALKPGSTRSRCIRVDYTGDLPSTIRLYVTTPAAGLTTLDPYLVMSVEEGQNVPAATTVAADCSTGFTPAATPAFVYNTKAANDATADATRTLSALRSARSDYASGIPVGGPAGAPVGSPVPQDTHLTFRITYLVKDDNGAQTTQSSATFVWEARNT
jgi:hypothetical protein